MKKMSSAVVLQKPVSHRSIFRLFSWANALRISRKTLKHLPEPVRDIFPCKTSKDFKMSCSVLLVGCFCLVGPIAGVTAAMFIWCNMERRPM